MSPCCSENEFGKDRNRQDGRWLKLMRVVLPSCKRNNSGCWRSCAGRSASWETKHVSELIQPTLLRCPEVILQAPWDKEVDIWNLGALLSELVDALFMFNGRAQATGGVYLTKHHIEEMEVLFGPFPAGLIKDGNPEIVQQLFDADYRVRDPTERPPVKLEMWIEYLEGEELARIMSMLRAMLTIDPKQRPTGAVE